MTLPTLTDCKSSNIAATGWHDGNLYVRFKSGPTWKYEGVSEASYKEMLAQESVGGYFGKHIKPHHKAERVPSE